MVKEARFRDMRNRKYDGLHMYGPSGKKAYTISVLNILKSAGIFKQMDGQTAGDYYRKLLNFEYQKRKTNMHHRTPRAMRDADNDIDMRKTRQSSQKKQNKQTEASNTHGHRYAVPTSNLFEHLNC